MDRKDFLKKGLLGTGILAASPAVAALVSNKIDELKPLEVTGFNHLPNPKTETMDNMVIHRASTRGQANHGWLNAKHSFSFANYYNPERMHFGVLRVLNDDTIAGGMGFGTHPHDNMEIITIPLSGALEHKDSMGNSGVISSGQVQVMSAGTGIYHSEFNHNKDKEVKLFQIWVFPNKENVTPRYDQIDLPPVKRNELQQILSPSADDEGVWIHQQSWFNIGEFDAGIAQQYKVKREGNGVYIMVVEGEVEIEGQLLNDRDAIGIWAKNEISFKSVGNSRLLFLDVPMSIG